MQKDIEFFRIFYENSPLPYQSLDNNGHYVEVNTAFLDTLGFKRDEVIGHFFGEFLTKTSRQKFKENFHLFKKVGYVSNAEFEIICKSGNVIRILLNGNVSFDPGGKFIQTHCVWIDITEQKKTEDALKQSEARYIDLYENAPDMYLSVNAKTALIDDCNETTVKTLGYIKNEIVGLPVYDIFHPDCLKEVKEIFKLFINTGEIHDKELMLKKKDGTKLDVSLNVSAVRDEKGKILFSRSTMRDITDRKQTEEALQSSEERLQLAAEAAQMGLWDWNIITGEVLWSDQCKAHYGISPETSMSYELFLKALHPDDRENVETALNRALKERSSYNETKRTIWPDGTVHWINSRGQAYSDSSGKPVRMIGVTFDVTELKEMEQTLIKREREFRTLAENSPDNIARYDTKCRVVYVNPILEKTLGTSASEMLGTTPAERASIGESKEYQEKVLAVLKTGIDTDMDLAMPDRGEGMHYYNIRFTAEREKDGTITGVLAIGRDTTERKFSETRMRESEKRFRALVTQAVDAFYLLDNEGQILDVNQSACTSLGYSREELLSLNISEIDKEVKSNRHKERFWDTIQPGKPVTFEGLHRRKDGSTFPVEVRLGILELGQDKYMLGLAREITERKKAEQERIVHLHFVESLDKINLTIHGTNDLEQMMSDVLDAVLSIFDCDQAWFLYPCESGTSTYRISMERTKSEYPGAYELGMEIPSDPQMHEIFKKARSSSGPVVFTLDSNPSLPLSMIEKFQVQSQMSMAIYPKVDKPYMFGIHQCSDARIWTSEEKRLFQEISSRLTDALTGLLSHRNLGESEEKYRLIAENTADVINIFDLDLNILYVSPSVKKLLGYTADEVMKRKTSDFLTSESKQKVKDVLTQQIALETTRNVDRDRSVILELEEYHKDGSTIWVELSASILRDIEQKPTSILTVSRNINKRKQAQLQLIESEQKFRSLAESIPDNIVRYDTEKNIIYMNHSMLNAVDIDLRKYLGRKADEIEKTPQVYLEKIDSVLHSGGQEELELEVKNPSGEVRTHNIRFVCERNNEGKVIGALAIGRDITENKQSQDTLRKLSHAVDQSPVTIIITNTEGRIEYVNPRFTEVSGYTPDEVIGKNPKILKSGESSQEFYKNLWNTILAGDVWRGEFSNRKKNAELYYESASISPIFDTSGKLTHFIAIKEDITEHKRLEEQFHQAQKMEAIGQLAGGIAHDFNNMLGVILGYSELLLLKVDQSQTIYKDLQEIRNAAINSSNLTRQLLTFARKQTVIPQVLDLNEAIEGMLKMLQRLISEQIILNWKPKTDLWPVHIDPSQVNQILANLCVNARDAIEGVGIISIETNKVNLDNDFCSLHPGLTPGEYVLLSVSDNGCGIDKKNLDKIFEPFFTTKELGKGTGLGLATIYGIVKQNDGYIDVYSEPGLGSTFKIYLPRHYRTAQKDLAEKKEIQLTGGFETILLVEDDKTILEMTKKMLEGLGYHVLSASASGMALRIAKKYSDNIDLIITDVIMPKMTGRDLAKKLMSIYPGIKCLYMSGYSGEVIAHNNVLEKDVNFIQKPFSLKDLSAAINVVKRKHKGLNEKNS